ncbi:MAG: hypothetical protein BWY09_01406 [Candidatus Hydrogenedentes bacterium ADurb.Bin179]|nr:MAG: hypothetical protein BWY09_01406 [Candidatus Hydrogenedentes bacterium ADurb.Bin179]
MVTLIQEFHQSQNEVVGLIQGVVNFVFGDRHGIGAGDAPFHLDDTQASFVGHAALDVIAEPFEFAVHGFVAEALFDVHDNGPGAGRGGLGVGLLRLGRQVRRLALHPGQQPEGRHNHAAEHHGRQRGYLGFPVQFGQPFLEACLQVVGTAARFL